MSMFNFALKEVDTIVPFDEGLNQSLHWFGLTDGEFHFEFGESKVYEYSDAARTFSKGETSRYVDYYISRFVEDFSNLFGRICEDVPHQLYDLSKDLPVLLLSYDKWLNQYLDDVDFHLDTSELLFSWLNDRRLDTGHLVHGPTLYFFKHAEKVLIVWDARDQLGNGEDVWTSRNGFFEMNYGDFLLEVKSFGDRFFSSMALQVHEAGHKDWKDIDIDKVELVGEHESRKKDFYDKVRRLECAPVTHTKWSEVVSLHEKAIINLS